MVRAVSAKRKPAPRALSFVPYSQSAQTNGQESEGMAHLRGGKPGGYEANRTKSLDQGGEAIRDYVLWDSGLQNKGASTVRSGAPASRTFRAR